MNRLIGIIALLTFLFGCKEKYTPKPRGYFRIDFPEKNYSSFSAKNYPYEFEIPDYAKIVQDKGSDSEPYWINLVIPKHKADIHISYKKIEGQKDVLAKYTEESRRFAYDHSVKADAIDEQLFFNPENRVYGTIYFIEGNAASPMQFYLTDSTNHFLRGSLYFREVPNIDSIKPVIEFLRPDIIKLIETTTWK